MTTCYDQLVACAGPFGCVHSRHVPRNIFYCIQLPGNNFPSRPVIRACVLTNAIILSADSADVSKSFRQRLDITWNSGFSSCNEDGRGWQECAVHPSHRAIRVSAHQRPFWTPSTRSSELAGPRQGTRHPQSSQTNKDIQHRSRAESSRHSDMARRHRSKADRRNRHSHRLLYQDHLFPC